MTNSISKPLISEEERQRRLDAVNYAHASMALEGFNFPEECQNWAMKYVNNEITLEEMVSRDWTNEINKGWLDKDN